MNGSEEESQSNGTLFPSDDDILSEPSKVLIIRELLSRSLYVGTKIKRFVVYNKHKK